MEAIKSYVRGHSYYKNIKDVSIKNEFYENPLNVDLALAYYAFLLEIAHEYYDSKKRRFDKNTFIQLVFETLDPSAKHEDIRNLLMLLTPEQKQTMTFRLNFFLHNLDIKRNVFTGLSFQTLAEDMLRSEITNQKDYLKSSGALIEKLLKGIKGSEYDVKRTKIENAMQDLIWNRLVKGAVTSSKESLSSSSLTKKQLLEKLKECEAKLAR